MNAANEREHSRLSFHPYQQGEPETHRAWFQPGTADGHFLMGCTFNSNHSLSFLGIYYTAEPSAISFANTATILNVTADGDVTILVDSHPVTFLAVQPFSTTHVITRWSNSLELSRNCEEPSSEHRSIHGAYVDFSSFDQDGQIKASAFPNPERSSKYLELLPSTHKRSLIYSWFNVILITTSGSIFVEADRFPEACHRGDPKKIANSTLLLHQLCRLTDPEGALKNQRN